MSAQIVRSCGAHQVKHDDGSSAHDHGQTKARHIAHRDVFRHTHPFRRKKTSSPMQVAATLPRPRTQKLHVEPMTSLTRKVKFCPKKPVMNPSGRKTVA